MPVELDFCISPFDITICTLGIFQITWNAPLLYWEFLVVFLIVVLILFDY